MNNVFNEASKLIFNVSGLEDVIFRIGEQEYVIDFPALVRDYGKEAERTCRFYDTDHEYEDSVRCSACQTSFRKPWEPFKYCPQCCAKVIGR